MRTRPYLFQSAGGGYPL